MNAVATTLIVKRPFAVESALARSTCFGKVSEAQRKVGRILRRTSNGGIGHIDENCQLDLDSKSSCAPWAISIPVRCALYDREVIFVVPRSERTLLPPSTSVTVMSASLIVEAVDVFSARVAVVVLSCTCAGLRIALI